MITARLCSRYAVLAPEDCEGIFPDSELKYEDTLVFGTMEVSPTRYVFISVLTVLICYDKSCTLVLDFSSANVLRSLKHLSPLVP